MPSAGGRTTKSHLGAPKPRKTVSPWFALLFSCRLRGETGRSAKLEFAITECCDCNARATFPGAANPHGRGDLETSRPWADVWRSRSESPQAREPCQIRFRVTRRICAGSTRFFSGVAQESTTGSRSSRHTLGATGQFQGISVQDRSLTRARPNPYPFLSSVPGVGDRQSQPGPGPVPCLPLSASALLKSRPGNE